MIGLLLVIALGQVPPSAERYLELLCLTPGLPPVTPTASGATLVCPEAPPPQATLAARRLADPATLDPELLARLAIIEAKQDQALAAIKASNVTLTRALKAMTKWLSGPLAGAVIAYLATKK